MIHPTAVVDPAAQVHESCDIGPYVVIGADVTIGAGNTIGPHTVINGPTSIAEENHIFQFVSIGADPQDLKFDGGCLLYTSPSPRDRTRSRMPSSA